MQAHWRPKSAAAMRSEMAMEHFRSRDERKPEPSPRREAPRMFLSPIGLAVTAAVVIFVLLYLINPPIVQTPTENSYELGNPDLKKIAVYSLIVGALAFLAPYVAGYFK